MKPFVSIIIPCRNEERYIGACLRSVIAQDYPKDRMEVLVVDGVSSDATWGIANKYQEEYAFIKVLSNPRKITPCALNIGIKHALGAFLIRMDAHSEYPAGYMEGLMDKAHEGHNVGGNRAIVASKKASALAVARYSKFGVGGNGAVDYVMIMGSHCEYPEQYVSKCVENVDQYYTKIGNVGGMLLPEKVRIENNPWHIARSDIFGIGKSSYRTGANKPQIVDTVFGGCYRREVFEKIGLFNENLERGQDLEFNLRLKTAGMKTMLIPDIFCYYHPRTEFWPWLKHNFQDGKWVTLSRRYAKNPITLRHLVPLAFVLTLPISIWPYIPLNLFRSVQLAIRHKIWWYAFALPWAFLALHISYGVGSVSGLFKCYVPTADAT